MTIDDPVRRAQETMAQLRQMPELLQGSIERALAETGSGSDHDGLVRVSLAAGGTGLQVAIDPAVYAAGDAADLAARISAAYREAFRAMSDRAARHGAALQAYGENLLSVQEHGLDPR